MQIYWLRGFENFVYRSFVVRVRTCAGEQDDDRGQQSDDVQTETLHFTLSRDVFNRLLVSDDARRLTDDWTSTMYAEFHKLWPTCGLVFERQYLSRRRRDMLPGEAFWYATAHCKVAGCVRVTLWMLTPADSTASVEVVCDVDGRCCHAEHPEGT